MTTAIIDIGSGSVKLLLTGADGTDEQDAIKTRLLGGIADDGTIDSEALAATEAALAKFAAVIEERGVTDVRVVATAAARAMADTAPLAESVRRTIGVELEVLEGSREASLSFAGAMADRELPVPVTLLDIGAGSTEFAFRTSAGDRGAMSLPVGSGTLTADYLHGDPPSAAELSSALSVVELHLDDLRRERPAIGATIDDGIVLGNGAVTQIAAVEIGLVDPDESVDGYVLTKSAVEEVFRALATETAEDRAFNPGLLPEHVDDIVGAMCVLVEFMRQFDVDELTVAESDLRHGLAAEHRAGADVGREDDAAT